MRTILIAAGISLLMVLALLGFGMIVTILNDPYPDTEIISVSEGQTKTEVYQ